MDAFVAAKRKELDESNQREFTVAPPPTAEGAASSTAAARAVHAAHRPHPHARAPLRAGKTTGDDAVLCSRVQAAAIQRDLQVRTSVVVNTQGPQSRPPPPSHRAIGIPHGLIDRLAALESHMHMPPPPSTDPGGGSSGTMPADAHRSRQCGKVGGGYVQPHWMCMEPSNDLRTACCS